MKGQTFENVWDALTDTPAEAVHMTMRSLLMMAIEDRVKSWETTQVDAARRLGIAQPRLNGLLRGKINDFSLDALISLAVKAGLSLNLVIGDGSDTPHLDRAA